MGKHLENLAARIASKGHPRSFVPSTYPQLIPKKGGAHLSDTPNAALVRKAVSELILSIEKRKKAEKNAA